MAVQGVAGLSFAASDNNHTIRLRMGSGPSDTTIHFLLGMRTGPLFRPLTPIFRGAAGWFAALVD